MEGSGSDSGYLTFSLPSTSVRSQPGHGLPGCRPSGAESTVDLSALTSFTGGILWRATPGSILIPSLTASNSGTIYFGQVLTFPASANIHPST